MFDVGGGELIVIVLAILILFGPKKIPEIAQMISKGMTHVRRAQQQFSAQINELQRDIKTAANVDIDGVNIIKESPLSVPTEKQANPNSSKPIKEIEENGSTKEN